MIPVHNFQGCGSFEVRLPDGHSQFFYWDDLPSRRLRPVGKPRWSSEGGSKGCAGWNKRLVVGTGALEESQ